MTGDEIKEEPSTATDGEYLNAFRKFALGLDGPHQILSRLVDEGGDVNKSKLQSQLCEKNHLDVERLFKWLDHNADGKVCASDFSKRVSEPLFAEQFLALVGDCGQVSISLRACHAMAGADLASGASRSC